MSAKWGFTAFVSVSKREKMFMVGKHLCVTLRGATARHGERLLFVLLASQVTWGVV